MQQRRTLRRPEDTDLISAKYEIDYHVKKGILGSRRILLFIEGNQNSLDYRIYKNLFPKVFVIPQGNCTAVKQAVNGITSTNRLHWIKAFGLIDADDRQQDELDKLEEDNIFSLPCYSVESLYYSADMIHQIALKQVSVTGDDADIMKTKALEEAIKAIKDHRERLCARLCVRKVRASIRLPTLEDIKDKDAFPLGNVNLKPIRDIELQKFDSFIASKDVDSIIGRYPVRETPVLNKIVEALGFKTREKYEGAVMKLLIDDNDVCIKTRNLLGKLVEKLCADT